MCTLIYYGSSIIHETILFNTIFVSILSKMEVTGANAQEFLEHVLVADLGNLPSGSSSLSVLTNANGGIIDDCIVTRTGAESFYIVSNAGCAEKDLSHLRVGWLALLLLKFILVMMCIIGMLCAQCVVMDVGIKSCKLVGY